MQSNLFSPASLLSMGIGLLANSIRFYEDAIRQENFSDFFGRSLYWFISFLIAGCICIGLAIGMCFKKEERPKGMVKKK